MKLVFNKLNIFSTNFLHFGHGIGPIEMELKKIENQHINNIGNWKPYIQDDRYWDNILINTVEVMERASENHKLHYNPMNVPKPNE